MPRTILSVADFGALPSGQDCTAALVRAAQACRGMSGVTLHLPPGRYRISPSRGSESWSAISNHDNLAPRRAALHLVGCRDLRIEGPGAVLEAEGQVVPILIEGGRDLALEGLGIDWGVPLHAWAEVVGGWNGWMDLRPTGGNPWRVVKERLCFRVDGAWEELSGTYAVDPRTTQPVPRSGDNCGSAFTVPYVAEELDGGVVRLRSHIVEPPAAGQVVILRHGLRLAPAIAAIGVERITLSDIAIGHAGGMGVVMQRCTDPTLTRVSVTALPGRPLSTNHDATHFVACRGTVRLADCRFERQLDDAANIHGIYHPIVERLDPRRLVVRLVHDQQRGNLVALPGERLGIVDRSTMLTVAEATVAEAIPVNREFTELAFTAALPEAALSGNALENLDWKPDIEIRGCQIGHNRARGLLIASGARVDISHCTFDSPGPAVLLHGDARFWYEAGAAGSVHIHHNRFRRCGYAREPRWGAGTILVAPEMERVAGPYHQRLVVEDNQVEDGLLPLVDARAVGELVVRRNQVSGGGGEVLHRECGTVTLD